MQQPPEEGDIISPSGPQGGPREDNCWTVQLGEICLCHRQEEDMWYLATITVIRRIEEDGKVEFYMHYSGSDPAVEEWVDGSRIVPLKHVEGLVQLEEVQNMAAPSQSEQNVMLQQHHEQEKEAQTPKKQKMEPGESAADLSITFHTEKSKIMEELMCPACLEFLTDPAILECGHNICTACVDNIWSSQEHPSCPKCKNLFTEKKSTPNSVLASLVQRIRRACPQYGNETKACQEHGEAMTLFCKEDGELVCVLCCQDTQHQCHTFLPIQNAVSTYKDKLAAAAPLVTSQLESLKTLQQEQEQKISQNKEIMAECKQHISDEFRKLHQFLHDKEESWMQQLKEEGEAIQREMEENLIKVNQDLQRMQETLSTIHFKLEQQDAMVFLKEIKSFAEKRCEKEVKSVPAMNVVSRELSRGCFRGPIQYRVWKEMKSVISPGLSCLKMDPQTAHPNLIISEDKASVRYSSISKPVPESSKRFSRRLAVLGQEGLLLGRHYWEVVVGDIPGCDVGVVRESIYRKGYFSLCPMDGCWVVSLRNDNLFVTLDSCTQTLRLSARPQRIGVYLDYEEGQLSFYNAQDMSHIYTFLYPFTGKMCPYVSHAKLATHAVALHFFQLRI